MGEQSARAIGEVRLEAVVRRADGTVEDLGTVAYWSRNPLKRAAARLLGVGKITTRKRT